MRAELQQLELIDAYLSGSMNAEARTSFEAEMRQSASLKEMVENQRLMIQVVKRQALLAEINQFSSPSGPWQLVKWLSALIVTGGLIAAGIYWKYGNSEMQAIVQQAETKATASETRQLAQTILEKDSSQPERTENVSGPAEMAIDDVVETLPRSEDLRNALPMISGAASGIQASEPKNWTKPEFDLKTWIEPKSQYFDVDPKKGETIECEQGTLVIVPTDAFVDKEGEFVVEHVRIEIVEALTAADMLAYNLTTTNHDKHLQSGGMVYIQPTVNGERVGINPERPLHIQIPTLVENPDMLAWKGQVDAKGNINWVNPQPLEKFLTPVSFEKLDFLPPGFVNEVEASLPFRNHQKMSRELADSLYYSLNQHERITYEVKEVGKTKEISLRVSVYDESTGEPLPGAKVRVYDYVPLNPKQPYPIAYFSDSVFTDDRGVISIPVVKARTVGLDISHPDFMLRKTESIPLPSNRNTDFTVYMRRFKPKSNEEFVTQINKSTYLDSSSICMIDPLSVKTIKTDVFANTFLATKEFEERIQVLHGMPNPQHLLNIYVNNLQANLWEADSLVSLQLSGANQKRFQDFTSQRKTNVKDRNIYAEQLSAYYNQRRDNYVATMAKMADEFKTKSGNELDKMEQKVSFLRKSYQTSGFEQPEIPAEKLADFRAVQPNPAVNYSYAVSWNQPGWMNIDCYNHLLSNGSKSVSISLGDQPEARVYQAINTMQTIIPLSVVHGKAKALFPQEGKMGSWEMKNTYCIGIQKTNGELSYAEHHYDPYANEEIALSWQSVTEKKLYASLRALPDADNQFADFLKTQQGEIERQQEIRARKEAVEAEIKGLMAKEEQDRAFIRRLRQIAGSCDVEKSKAYAYVHDYDVARDVSGPEFPGGKDALVKFMNKNLRYPKEITIQDEARCFVNFSVGMDGSISDIVIVKGVENCPECDEEIIRTILAMPKWEIKKNLDLPFTSSHKFLVEMDISTRNADAVAF